MDFPSLHFKEKLQYNPLSHWIADEQLPPEATDSKGTHIGLESAALQDNPGEQGVDPGTIEQVSFSAKGCWHNKVVELQNKLVSQYEILASE